MNRLTYSLRRSLLMSILSKISRRVNLSSGISRELSETKIGALISTASVLTDWDLATGQNKPRLMVSATLFLGHIYVGLSVTL